MIDRKLKKKGLQELTHLSPSVITKMGRNESVHLDTLAKICYALRCNIEDIVETSYQGEVYDDLVAMMKVQAMLIEYDIGKGIYN